MQANELMTGDWVLIKRTPSCEYPYKICSINNYSILGEDYADWIEVEAGEEINLEDIKPIPLTAEILEKNGFTHRNADKILTKQSWTFADEDCTIHAKYNFGVLYFDIYGKPLKVDMFRPHITMHIQYVHQLQHALRLCGIDKEIVL